MLKVYDKIIIKANKLLLFKTLLGTVFRINRKFENNQNQILLVKTNSDSCHRSK